MATKAPVNSRNAPIDLSVLSLRVCTLATSAIGTAMLLIGAPRTLVVKTACSVSFRRYRRAFSSVVTVPLRIAIRTTRVGPTSAAVPGASADGDSGVTSVRHGFLSEGRTHVSGAAGQNA